MFSVGGICMGAKFLRKLLAVQPKHGVVTKSVMAKYQCDLLEWTRKGRQNVLVLTAILVVMKKNLIAAVEMEQPGPEPKICGDQQKTATSR